ncbi:MAG: DUF418 domain-containing protein [Flavobacteriales bacterium]|nr:DUF418 domain-containing protein [Flavobacteriales bacterium]
MKAPRIVGLDLANAISLPGLFLASYALVLTDQYTKLSGAEYEFSLDIWAAIYVFASGMIGTIMMRGRNRRSIKQKQHSVRKGVGFLVLGMIITTVWPVNFLVMLGLCFILTPWLSLLNSAILRFLTMAIFLCALLLEFLQPEWVMPGIVQVYADNHLSILKYVQYLVFSGRYALFPFVAFYIAGMTFARKAFLEKRVARLNNILALGGIVAGFAFHLLWNNAFSLTPTSIAAEQLPFRLLKIMNLPAFALLGVSIPVVVINVMNYVARHWGHWKLVQAFAKLGAMKHSAYLMHLLLGISVLWAINHEHFTHYRWLLALSAFAYVSFLILAVVWKKRHNLGPVEWALERLAGNHE